MYFVWKMWTFHCYQVILGPRLSIFNTKKISILSLSLPSASQMSVFPRTQTHLRVNMPVNLSEPWWASLPNCAFPPTLLCVLWLMLNNSRRLEDPNQGHLGKRSLNHHSAVCCCHGNCIHFTYGMQQDLMFRVFLFFFLFKCFTAHPIWCVQWLWNVETVY